MQKYYIGLLSGTSMDAIDAALVSFSEKTPKLLAYLSHPIPKEFKNICLKIAQTGQSTIDEYGSLDATAGQLFADAANNLIAKTGMSAKDIAAIGSHGQTLRHCPNNTPPFSLQIGDPNIIAERTGIPTVADFRRRDIAAGGQGAPLAPGFHQMVFGSQTEHRVIVNIGGITNITILNKDTPEKVFGFDTGPGNCLMDSMAMETWNQPYDDQGKFAKQGNYHPQLLHQFLNDNYFSKTPPKSTGREYFNLMWLAQHLNSLHAGGIQLSSEDIQATLLMLTASTVTAAIQQYGPSDAKIFVCGGGVHNTYLMETLEKMLMQPVKSVACLDLAPDWIEAILFAWLAKQTLSGKSGNCPSVTGASRAIPLGGIYGLRLAEI